jgi:hypothetical protein
MQKLRILLDLIWYHTRTWYIHNSHSETAHNMQPLGKDGM